VQRLTGSGPQRDIARAVAKPSAAEKEVRGSPLSTAILLARTPKKAKPSAATRPSAAGKRCSGVFPDYGNPTRTHAGEGHAERSGQAERSCKDLPTDNGTTQHAPVQNTAKRSGQAERSVERGVIGSRISIFLVEPICISVYGELEAHALAKHRLAQATE
jgi:hypothetical protein